MPKTQESEISNSQNGQADFVVDAWPLEDLFPSPFSLEVYGDGCDAGLIESVKQHGVLEPLIITPDGLVISGHQRLDAAKQAGLATVPVIVSAGLDKDQLQRLILDTNVGRKKTNEQ